MSSTQNVQTDDAIAGPQHEVQRKLGRSLLQLQQYELLLKELIVHSEESGTIDTMVKERRKRTKETRLKTLGGLLRTASKTLIRTAPFEELPDLDELHDKPYLRMRSALQLSPEDGACLKADLKRLLKLRNRLVHHFLAHFNIFSVEGCHAASAHLDESYVIIKTAYTQLIGWAENLQQLRQQAGVYIQSDAFKNALKSQLRSTTGATDDPT